MARFGHIQGVILLLLVSALPVVPVLTRVRHPVPVLWMMPVSSGSGRENLSAGLVPAVRMALQDLQEQPEPLGNYEIQLQLLDSQCDPAEALRVLFDTMWAGPRYLLMIGGACPPVAALIARALPALSLVQVSFVAPPPSLSNKKWSKNLFSTMPSVRTLNQVVVKLLQRYRWRRVGVISGDGPRLAEMKKDLTRQLLKADVQLAATETFSEDACSRLKELKDRDVRIIIGQFEEDSASEVFCCAYRLNLFGPRYQWILAAGWRLGWQPSACSADSLLMAADGSFRLQIRHFSTSSSPGVSGRTPQNFRDSFRRQLVQQGSKVNPLHTFAYDAVWVAARALSRVMEALKLREKYGAARNVTVSEEEEVKMLLEAVKNEQFEGVTGPVSFQNGERMTTMELIQLQGDSGVLVGEFSSATQQLRMTNHLLKFKGPGPVADRTVVLLQRRPVSLLLYSVMSSAAAGTIFITLLILCFIIINHRRWLLRSGSAQDLLLLLGLLLSSSSVLLSGLDDAQLSDETFHVLCSARLWTLSAGYSVSLAVLITRTWRIYSVCSIEPKPISCALIWVFLLDLSVLTSWQIVDPLKWVVLHHSTEEYLQDQDVIIRPFSERCSSNYLELWLTAVYGYKITLLAFGCFLAWTIRTSDPGPPAVNRKFVPISVLGVAAFSVSGVFGSVLTSHYPPLQFCLSSILILSCALFILSSLFGPQIFHVLRSSSELQDEAANEEEEEELRRSNQELKCLGAQLDIQVESFTMQLAMFLEEPGGENAEAGVRSLTHEAQICSPNKDSERKRPDDVNSPEHVRRRLSVQLPILHHSYLPIIGGISTSTASLFSSQEVFLHHHDNFLYA